MEALRNKDKFTIAYKINKFNRFYKLFFSYIKSQEILKQNPDVLIINGTYKTNEYKIPLIDIIGITNINTNFFIAFAFVQNKDKEAYTWVLNYLKTFYLTHELPLPIVIRTDRELALINSLETVFSTIKHMLCSWYIKKVIVVFCRPYFRGRNEDDWLAFINK
jgi:hypothetical protein